MKFVTVVLMLNCRFGILFGLFFFPLYCQAQCVNRTELLALVDSCRSKPYLIQTNTLLSVLSIWKKCKYSEDSVYVNIKLELAKAQARNGDIELAIIEIKNTLKLYQKQSPFLKPEDQVKAYYRLGSCWKEINNYKEATKASEMAVKLGARLPGTNWTSFACHTLAYICFSTGEYEKAIDFSNRGMYEAKRANDSLAYLETWTDKIKSLIALNKLDEGKQELIRAIAIARKTLDAKDYLAFFLARRAKLSRINLSFSNAVKSYKEALYIGQLIKDEKIIINNCIDIGYLYYEMENYPASLNYYNRAMTIVNDPYTKLRLLDNIGAVYWKQKKYTTALAYYQGGLNAVPLGFTKRQLTALPDAELIRLASQKEYLLTLIQDKADTWLDYAKATGDNRQRLLYALDTYTVADQMIDFMRWEHTGQQSKLFWRQTTRGMYERAIETCFRLGDAEQAFRFLEKSRAVMLADKLNELGARQKLSRQQVEQEEQLQRVVSSQQSKLADIKPGDSIAYNSARMDLLSKQDSLSRFLKNLEASNPAYYGYKYDNKTATLADLQRYLKKQSSSLITYFVGDSALYVLGIMGDTALLQKQPVTGYKKTLNQFARLLENPEAMSKNTDVARFRMLSNNLYGRLLAPLALPEGRVIVSPDGFSIPLEALSLSAMEFDYAVNHYAFSYVYSASLLLKNGAVHARTPGYGRESFLGVAPVEFSPTLQQVKLPKSDITLNTIAGRFDSPTLLTHKAATRRNFLTQATTARIIHLFTHATADSTDQEPTLYFADSTLQLSDFSDNALPNAQLVVLAACKTGIGANQRGEGVFSLARGFAALGVPSVLTTLWSVQNEATYTLTDLFYSYLDEGLPKDIALQRAKQDWLKTAEGANGLPNYWAGLIVVGDAEPLPRINIILWGSVLLLFIIAAGLIFWHERPKRRTTRPVSWPQPA